MIEVMSEMDSQNLTNRRIICRGVVPATKRVCGSLLLIGGPNEFYYPSTPVLLVIELKRLVVICQICGFKTRLHYAPGARLIVAPHEQQAANPIAIF